MEDGMISPVETPIADEHRFTGVGALSGFDADLVGASGIGLEDSDDVGDDTEFLFELPIHQLDGAGVETGTGELSERA